MDKIKLTLIAWIGFIVISAIGMYMMHSVFGSVYGSPDMVRVLVWMEVALLIWLVLIARRGFTAEDLGFVKIKSKELIWFVPIGLAIGAMVFVQMTNLLPMPQIDFGLLAILFVTVALVAINEEILSRGMAQTSFSKQYGMWAGVLISAVIFSLIHAPNVLGGLPFEHMIGQLWATFVAGLFYALLRVRVRSIVPIIVLHFAYDYFLFAGGVIATDEWGPYAGYLSPVANVTLIALVAAVFYSSRKQKLG